MKAWMRQFGQLSLCLSLWIGAFPVLAQQIPSTPPAATSDELDVRWTKLYAEAAQRQLSLPLTSQPLDDNMSRLELARWLARAFDLRPTGKTVPLKDVSKNNPDYGNAQAVVQAGLMLAPGGLFKPKDDLTKLEALAIFDRGIKVTALPKPLTDSWLSLYSDTNSVPAAGRDFIAAAAQAGLIVNVPKPDVLGPDDVLTRGETAVLLHQSLVYLKKIASQDAPIAQLRIEKPSITDIQIQPNGVVRAGDTVTVVAKGTPGSTVVFDFAGMVKDVPMTETTPGTYRGTYQIAGKDSATNPPVAVRLSRSGLNTRVQKIAKLQVGEPRIAQAPQSDPNDDEPAAPPQGQPVYRDPYNDGSQGGDPYGRSSTPRSGYPTTSYPPTPTPRSGTNPFNPVQPFDPAQRQSTLRIDRVGFDPEDRILYARDVLTVSMLGDPGGKATFRIVGYTPPILMQEISSGVYEGKVQIGYKINVPGGKIEVVLERSKQRTSRVIETPINISANP
jgi:S-layer homology domain